MHKRTFIIGIILVLAVAWCMNAYAMEGEVTAWNGFWNCFVELVSANAVKH